MLGSESLLPMAIIRFVMVGKRASICPFCAILANNKQKKIQGICIIGQYNKPPACYLFPLGRFVAINQDTKKEDPEQSMYFIQKCPATNTTKTVPVREYIERFSRRNDESSEYYTTISAVIVRLRSKHLPDELIKRLMSMMASVLFGADGKTMDKLKKIDEQLVSMGF
jgi:hypothetical protein